MPVDRLSEIKTLYFKATRATIDRDFDRAIDLLKAMPEDDRHRAAVFMEGLAEMRKEFKTRRRPHLTTAAIWGRRNLRAASLTDSGTLRSMTSILRSRSFSRCSICIEIPGGVLGFFVSPEMTP